MPRHGIIADEIIAADEVVKSGVSSALSDVKLRDGVTFWNINRAALSIWWALRTSVSCLPVNAALNINSDHIMGMAARNT